MQREKGENVAPFTRALHSKSERARDATRPPSLFLEEEGPLRTRIPNYSSRTLSCDICNQCTSGNL